MSKELEALKRTRYNSSIEVVDDFDVIEKALQRLETIENANPNEALKCLEKLEIQITNRIILNEEEQLNFCNTIKQALLKAQEQEKVLKILFEKNVTIFWLKECKSLEEYNYNTADYMKLTQEEFDLLKRWIE